MKKLFIAIAVFATLIVGAGSAQAANWEPNGEEQVVTLTPPSALHGCARVANDVQGVDNVYVPYGDTQELVASWSINSEDPDFFIVTATLQSQFYSLNNPLKPGRSTEATFQIERCPAIETPPTIDDVPLLPPNPEVPSEQAPDGVFKPILTGTEPVIPVTDVVVDPVVEEAPVVTKPVETAPVIVAPVEAEKTVPVVETQAVPVVKEELAATGLNEGVAWFGLGLLAFGISCLLLARKMAKNK